MKALLVNVAAGAAEVRSHRPESRRQTRKAKARLAGSLAPTGCNWLWSAFNVSNPGAVRVKIEQIEEDLRDAGGIAPRHRDQLMRLAELYRELRLTEKAVDILKGA